MIRQIVTAAETVLGVAHQFRLNDIRPYSDAGSLPPRSQSSEALGQRWRQSQETDFDIYKVRDYDIEMLYCWEHFTGPSLQRMLDFLMTIHLDQENILTTLDLEGGVGMSSVLLALQYPSMTHFAHVPHHYEQAERLVCHTLSKVQLLDTVVKCDLLIAQEVFEHVSAPITDEQSGINVVLDLAQPQFYYDGSSFELIDAPGHFRHNKYVRPAFERALRDRGYEVIWRDVEFSWDWDKAKPIATLPSLWYRS